MKIQSAGDSSGSFYSRWALPKFWDCASRYICFVECCTPFGTPQGSCHEGSGPSHRRELSKNLGLFCKPYKWFYSPIAMTIHWPHPSWLASHTRTHFCPDWWSIVVVCPLHVVFPWPSRDSTWIHSGRVFQYWSLIAKYNTSSSH